MADASAASGDGAVKRPRDEGSAMEDTNTELARKRPKEGATDESTSANGPNGTADGVQAPGKAEAEAATEVEAPSAVLRSKDEVAKEALTAERIEYGERLKLLLDSFTPEQRERHEYFRRSKFNGQDIKKIIQSVTGGPPPTKLTQIVMGGIAKVFAGEIVEEAREVMQARGESGPLTPDHIRTALHNVRMKGLLPTTQYTQGRLLQ